MHVGTTFTPSHWELLLQECLTQVASLFKKKITLKQKKLHKKLIIIMQRKHILIYVDGHMLLMSMKAVLICTLTQETSIIMQRESHHVCE